MGIVLIVVLIGLAMIDETLSVRCMGVIVMIWGMVIAFARRIGVGV